MPVPTSGFRCQRNSVWSRPALVLSVLIAMFMWPPTARGARGPQPLVTIPLDSLGFQALPQRNLLGGSSMITLDYVDSTHLLVTFHARKLIRRIPGDPPTDEDRNVDALLLELPSGRALARTE